VFLYYFIGDFRKLYFKSKRQAFGEQVYQEDCASLSGYVGTSLSGYAVTFLLGQLTSFDG